MIKGLGEVEVRLTAAGGTHSELYILIRRLYYINLDTVEEDKRILLERNGQGLFQDYYLHLRLKEGDVA
jgi:hypothetical protein